MTLFRTIVILLVLCIIIDACQSRRQKKNSHSMSKDKRHLIKKKFIQRQPKLIPKKTKDSICQLPKNIGSCREVKSRFYYNSVANKCKPFIYTGCHGNSNNFRSLSKCEKTCKV